MRYLSIFMLFALLLVGCAPSASPSQASQAGSQLDDSFYNNNPYHTVKVDWLYNPDDTAAASAIYSLHPKLEGVGISAETAKELYSQLPLDQLVYQGQRSTAPEAPLGDFVHIYPSDQSYFLWLDRVNEEAILKVGAEEYYTYTLSQGVYDQIERLLAQNITDDQRLEPAPLTPPEDTSPPTKVNPSP